MRKSYVQVGGVLYEKGTEPQEPLAPMVIGDIKPYQSMIDGRMITSRSQHREHLKANKCVEIGNETKYLQPKERQEIRPEARKELIRAQVDAMRESDFRQALKRDIERVKWNSRNS